MEPQHPANYDFIINPEKPQRGLVAPTSLKQRVLILGGGLVLLLVIGSFVMQLLKGSDNTKPALVSVLQQQQELLHLTQDTPTQTGVSPSNSSAAITIQLSIGSEQQELLTYLKQNHIKVSAKDIALGISAKTDADIKTAIDGGNYNTVLHSTLIDKLTSYRQYLVRAYSTAKGARGRALLKQDTANADLLLTQLQTTAN
jgi:hypothetical protein